MCDLLVSQFKRPYKTNRIPLLDVGRIHPFLAHGDGFADSLDGKSTHRLHHFYLKFVIVTAYLMSQAEIEILYFESLSIRLTATNKSSFHNTLN